MKKRIAVFSYSGRTENIDGYVSFLLGALRESVSYIITIVSRDCPEGAAAELRKLSEDVLVSDKNTLFSAYAKGAAYIRERGLVDKYGEAVLLDDSFFGPFCSFEEVFEKANTTAKNVDFWGISREDAFPEEMTGCKYNLQPFFAVIRKRLLISADFADFWKNTHSDPGVRSLTQHFVPLGYEPGYLFSASDGDILSLIKESFPVLPQAVFGGNSKDIISRGERSHAADILRYIRENTSYDTGLIMDKVVREKDPLELARIMDNIFFLSEGGEIEATDNSGGSVLLLLCPPADPDGRAVIPENVDVILLTESEGERAVAEKNFPGARTLCRGSECYKKELSAALSGHSYIGYAEGYFPGIWGKCRDNVTEIFKKNPGLGLLLPLPEVGGKRFGEISHDLTEEYKLLSEARAAGEALPKISFETDCAQAFWCRSEVLMPLAVYSLEKNEDILPRGIGELLPWEAKARGFCCGWFTAEAVSDAGKVLYALSCLSACLDRTVPLKGCTLKEYEKKLSDRLAALDKLDDVRYLENHIKAVRTKAAVIRRSKFFNKKWYLRKYPEARKYGLPPEYHYLSEGWKKGFDPSEEFSGEEYLKLNSDVRRSGICPLVHFECYGRNERRPYKTENGNIVRAKPPAIPVKLLVNRLKGLLRQIKYYLKFKIKDNKIIFRTFQNDYTCNPKYICEELLWQKLPFEIVWIAENGGKKNGNFPAGVRLVKSGSPEAMAEIMTSKIIIDNGILPYRSRFLKKKGQISINTWHGSMGFKRLDGNQLKRSKITSELYNNINDYIISDSEFEDEVFRNSNWKKTEFIKCGHPRNDILISCDKQKTALIRDKVYMTYRIPENKRLVLYAPTFREKIVETNAGGAAEEIDLDLLCDVLEKKFGGEWCVLLRAHFVNAKMDSPIYSCRHRIYSATDYPDIQELMIAADAGVTDYSSWILDYMYTRKPAFLYTPDYDDYDLQRGFYYPLSESPFPAARNNSELPGVIDGFDSEEYDRKINEFLQSKGSREDGGGSRAVVEFIKKLMNYKEGKGK